MSRYRAVIFDLDGTLLNTLEDIRDSVNEILRRHDYPLRELEEIRSFVGNGELNLIRRAIPESCTEEAECCRAEYSAYYSLHSRICTRPYEGVLELLGLLRERKIHIAVVSNKREETVQELCRAYFPGLIQEALGDREGFRKKPHPDNVERAMRLLGTEASDTLYVGDSEVDVETAGNCGMDIVSVSWGFRSRAQLEEMGARGIIDNPTELWNYL